ncbi:Scr1 family TA system antitoxin-like transcriptional regulator [Streptosporangium canum]|uniref:Scr1 family TA system antitoxin-like transcriptional regulator n=1 Tax=Streptosporangium canum TaxID=324952 RepID=UPI00341D4EEE
MDKLRPARGGPRMPGNNTSPGETVLVANLDRKTIRGITRWIQVQTAEYARLALAFGRDADEEDAAKAAAVRVEAQAALFESGREFSFVLTEGAVRTWPGSPALMRAQLDRLVQVSTLPHVGLGVVPWSVEAPPFLP